MQPRDKEERAGCAGGGIEEGEEWGFAQKKKVYLLQSILVLVSLFTPNHWALERLVFLGWDHDRTGLALARWRASMWLGALVFPN